MRFLLSLTIFFALAAQAAPKPKWTVVFFSGIDEEEIASYADEVVEQLLRSPRHANYEMLLENDTTGPTGITRVIRRSGQNTVIKKLPEHDSADTKRFSEFLKWVKENATGERTLFVVMTHSWGWKGIIQDYSIPGAPGLDTMMPLREFSRVMMEADFRPDVLFLDSCVLGNVEALEEFKDLSRYLVVSERETPYAGFPYKTLWPLLKKVPAPRELARALPSLYVRAFTRGGALVKREGEYDVVSVAALDMKNWWTFREDFRELVDRLSKTGFRETLQASPARFDNVADLDFNVDMVEFLRRLPAVSPYPGVLEQSGRLLSSLAYPTDEQLRRSDLAELKGARSFVIAIQGDENLESDEKALKAMQARWDEANEDLASPVELAFDVGTTTQNGKSFRTFLVRGKAPQGKTVVLKFRPWLPGVKAYSTSLLNAQGKRVSKSFTRKNDFVDLKNFPSTSLFVSEAHSGGAPFIHGFGMTVKPLMNDEEERGQDPLTRLMGPAFYKTTSWNQYTGWGNLMLLK